MSMKSDSELPLIIPVCRDHPVDPIFQHSCPPEICHLIGVQMALSGFSSFQIESYLPT